MMVLNLFGGFMNEVNYKLAAEVAFFKEYVSNIYPTGVVSYVSDTYNFWDVISHVAQKAKKEILARQPNAIGLAKVVFRPDSSDPADILCGREYKVINSDYTERDARNDDETVLYYEDTKEFWEVEHEDEYGWDGESWYWRTNKIKQLKEVEVKGAVEVLWDIFGGTVTETGHKILDSHVGLIYGDSITIARAKNILRRLEAKGFASANVVFGIGSYTYQYVTRDTHGIAIKSTWGKIKGEAIEIFKDPVTDSGVKKSAKGLLKVIKDENGGFKLLDQQHCMNLGEMQEVFCDSVLTKETTLVEARERIEKFVAENTRK